jgi:hypothetical protein
MLIADGLDDALIGIGRRCGQPDLAVYSTEKCIQILVERDGMDEDEAREYLEFNTFGAWVDGETPVWVELMGVQELKDTIGDSEGDKCLDQ